MLDSLDQNCLTIQCGANYQTINLAEGERITVGDVRNRLGDVMNIAPNSLAVIGDVEVDDDFELKNGNVLQFIKRSGSKG